MISVVSRWGSRTPEQSSFWSAFNSIRKENCNLAVQFSLRLSIHTDREGGPCSIMYRIKAEEVRRGTRMRVTLFTVSLIAFLIADVAEPQLMTELLKQAPSAAATIVMALAFLKYQKNRDDAFLSYLKQRDMEYLSQQTERDKQVVKLGDECHSFQLRLAGTITTALEKNAQALDRNTEAFGRMGAVCEQMESLLSRMDGDLVRMDTLIASKMKGTPAK